MHDGNIFFHSMVCGLRDHSPLYVNLYVLGYEYCPCHYPPLHFYYCQIDKILTEEWVMAYTACGIMVCYDLYTCGIMVCFSAILLYYIELNVQLEDFKKIVTGFGRQ